VFRRRKFFLFEKINFLQKFYFYFSWHKLANKDGKFDKDRGEIEVSLQFYSKNNDTGSVMDLATKRKHLSLKDIKHSLGNKLKSASRHQNNNHGGENQV